MRYTALALAAVIPFTLACMGGPGGDTIVRIDYSNVDGESCLIGGGKPSLAYKQEWDVSSCAGRDALDDSTSDPCRAQAMTECCDQIGADFVGWQAFQLGGEKLVGPLCKL